MLKNPSFRPRVMKILSKYVFRKTVANQISIEIVIVSDTRTDIYEV